MSSEVGSGHISIFPVMTGFKSRVTKGTQEAGSAGAKSFEGGFKGAGMKAGRTLGKDLKSAMSAAAGDLGAAELGKLNSQVASASAALSKARLRQQDGAGKVRVAEVRLQEAIAKSGEGSSQAVAAEERLAAARRVQGSATDAVTAASLRLKSAQDAVHSASAAMAESSVRSAGGLRQMASGFRDGVTNANAAKSAFSGVAGSIGGVLRAVSDVSGLTHFGRLIKLTSQQAYRSFTSLATMIGGGLSRAVQRPVQALGSFASAVGAKLAPIGSFAANAAKVMASPFVKLGSQVSSFLSPVTTQVSSLFSKLGAVGGPAASRLVSSFGAGISRLGSSAASGLQSVVAAAQRAGSAAGQALGAGLKNTATAGVAAAAAAIGVALGSGLSRLSSIDTARAKLTGLGNDGMTVAKIMNDASASVRGTSFGLGEAATVAASAVAAGIKPGEALQGHLKSIANNASAAGLSMQDMGSIFNKAATQANGVQNDVISQLADKGIPIYQALAEQMGVTAGEVFKMASEGKVDFATFSAAATKAAGTVADEIGKTVPGAWKNMRASLGRSGANIFGGINKETGEMYGLFARIAPLIQSVTKAMAPLEERSAAIGAKLDTLLGPALDRITGFFTRISEGAGLVGTGFEKLTGIAGPLGGVMAALGAGGLASILTKIPMLSALLPGLSGALGLLGGPLGIVAAAFAGFALTGGDTEALVSSLTTIISSVVAALPGLVSQIATFVPQLLDSILSQVPALLGAGVEIVGVLIQGLVTAIPVIATGALALVQGLITAIVANLPMIIQGAIALVMALIQGIVTAVPLLITAALQLVSGLLTAIVGALPMIIEGGIQLLMALVLGIVGALPQLLTAAVDLVLGLLGAIITNLPLIIEAGIQLLLSLVTGLIDALPQLITAAISLVLQLVVGLLTMLPQLVEAGITLVVSLITGLVKAIPQIIEMLPQIVSAIWDGLAAVDWLDLGAQIIQGIIDGFFSMVGSVGDAIGEVVGGILDFFPHSPAKKGPLSSVGWRQLKTSGAATMGQFIDGADGRAPAFGDSLADAASAASTKAQAAMSSVSAEVSASVASRGAPASSSSSTASQAAGQPEFTQINHFDHLPPEVAVEMAGQRLTSVARRARA